MKNEKKPLDMSLVIVLEHFQSDRVGGGTQCNVFQDIGGRGKVGDQLVG